jgi:predicted DNA-binding transcriptional regulator AlpA/DNA-directed RNA polymerase subunit RPC12/RpoP
VFSFLIKGERGLKVRVEGVYTYFCSLCETVFAVVSRLSVKQDKYNELTCPKCQNKARLYGEGYITHKLYSREEKENKAEYKDTSLYSSGLKQDNKLKDYPDVLSAKDIAEFLGVSLRTAYGIMEQKGFPLIRIGRSKKATKVAFIEWLANQESK